MDKKILKLLSSGNNADIEIAKILMSKASEEDQALYKYLYMLIINTSSDFDRNYSEICGYNITNIYTALDDIYNVKHKDIAEASVINLFKNVK